MPRSNPGSTASSISTRASSSAATRSSPGAAGLRQPLVTLEVHGVTDADARGSEPVTKDGATVGRTTSGGYGWRTGKSLALAMVRPEFAAPGTEVDIRVLGETRRAVVIADSPYDPQNKALRG